MIAVTEPATLITDYLMGGLALLWWHRLGALPASTVRADWRQAFLLLAIASFAGGSYHGFHTALSEPLPAWLWLATLASAALTSAYLLMAGTGQFAASGHGAWRLLAWLKAMVVILASLAWPDFLLVLADFAVSMLVIAFFAVRRWEWDWTAPNMFLAGLGIFVLAGAIQALEVAPHPRFNHNDLFHVVQIAGNWMLYRCAGQSASTTATEV